MKKSLKTLSFIPSLLKGKCMLLLVMLFTFSFAYGQTDEKTQKASALRKEGMTLHDQGKFEEAIKKYDEALKILPYDAILTYEKAYSLTAMGNKNEAKEQLENLFKQGKTDDALSMPYMLYANLLDNDGKAMQALEAFDKALEYVSPSDVAGIQLINYNKALTLYNLKDEDKAKIANRTQQIFNHLYNSIKCNPTHPASFGLYGRIMADEGGYYNAMACFGINALLVGEKVKVLETALNEWENKNITPNSGPLTTLALNKVKEVLKSEPSKYGKLYDIFTTVIPAICRDTLGTPVPFSYAYDLTDDGIMPFFSELKRQNLLECFFHVAMKNAKVQYKSNTEWLTAHKSEEERLWNTIGKLEVFKKDLKYGYVPDPVEFKTAETAHQHNIDAMAACKFYMTHTLDSKGMPNVKKYIVTWSTASPDVNIVIGKQAMDLTMTNADYLLAYIAGCSYYALTSHQKKWNIDTFSSGITEVVKLYAANKDILGKNKNLDKLLKLYQSEGDGYKKFIEESFKKEK